MVRSLKRGRGVLLLDFLLPLQTLFSMFFYMYLKKFNVRKIHAIFFYVELYLYIIYVLDIYLLECKLFDFIYLWQFPKKS